MSGSRYSYPPGTSGSGTFPKFSVGKGGTDQTGIASATLTKVTWPTEIYDTNNNFASDKFTPTVAGKYKLSVSIYFVGPLSSGFPEVDFYLNGSLYRGSFTTNAGTGGLAVTTVADIDMNGSTDFVEVFAAASTLSTLTISGDAHFTYWMGALLP